jgi:hypothetical protein
VTQKPYSLDEKPESESGSEEKNDQKLLEEAKARFKLAEDAEAEIRREALDDLKFLVGDQWDAVIRKNREADRRPCLTINRLPQHVQQITNDQRQNRPSLKVHAVDDQADPETAKIIQGLFRHIEYNSSADSAYDTAFEATVCGGLGYFRALTEYADPLSFDQEILIKRIRNRFSVFFDPYSQEPDGSDANFAFIVDDISSDEFRSRYPKSKLASSGQWETLGAQSPDWIKGDSVRIAEYFYREYKDEPICLLSNGAVIKKSEFPEGFLLPEGVSIVNERVARVPTVKWRKINGCETLEKTDLPGFWIPIIPVYGSEYIVDGKRVLKGVVRDAKDSQRLYNVMKSAEIEAIGLAPKAPFVAEENQLEGYEADWETANQRNHSFLKYKAFSVNGTPLPPPQRMAFEPAVMAITQAAMGAAEDLKSTTGIYDAALGARSNETSGKAILARNNQAQTSNYHYVDNLTRSLKHLGRILIAWIPEIYDTYRALRIVGEDGEQRVVKVNGPFEDKGKEVLYDFSVGKYDVTVDTGPSFATKRLEATQFMQEMVRSYPPTMQLAGDLVVKNMDVPGSAELAERFKKTLPPNLQDNPEKPGQIPPEVQAQLEQSGQLIEQLTGQLNELQSEKEQKLLELESRERIEFKKLEVQLEIKRAELDAKDSHALLSAEIAQVNERLNLLHMDQPIDPEVPQQFASQDGGQDPAMSSDAFVNEPTGGFSPGTPMEELP